MNATPQGGDRCSLPLFHLLSPLFIDITVGALTTPHVVYWLSDQAHCNKTRSHVQVNMIETRDMYYQYKTHLKSLDNILQILQRMK